MTIERMTKSYISILKTNMSSLEIRLRKIDETSNYLLNKIKHSDLMSEKYKNTCKYLNYVQNLLILSLTILSSIFMYLHLHLLH